MTRATGTTLGTSPPGLPVRPGGVATISRRALLRAGLGAGAVGVAALAGVAEGVLPGRARLVESLDAVLPGAGSSHPPGVLRRGRFVSAARAGADVGWLVSDEFLPLLAGLPGAAGSPPLAAGEPAPHRAVRLVDGRVRRPAARRAAGLPAGPGGRGVVARPVEHSRRESPARSTTPPTSPGPTSSPGASACAVSPSASTAATPTRSPARPGRSSPACRPAPTGGSRSAPTTRRTGAASRRHSSPSWGTRSPPADASPDRTSSRCGPPERARGSVVGCPCPTTTSPSACPR